MAFGQKAPQPSARGGYRSDYDTIIMGDPVLLYYSLCSLVGSSIAFRWCFSFMHAILRNSSCRG